MGFKCRTNAFLLAEAALSLLQSSTVFPFHFFLSIDWYCGAGIFGLIGCMSLTLSLALPTFFNNNNNDNYQSLRTAGGLPITADCWRIAHHCGLLEDCPLPGLLQYCRAPLPKCNNVCTPCSLIVSQRQSSNKVYGECLRQRGANLQTTGATPVRMCSGIVQAQFGIITMFCGVQASNSRPCAHVAHGSVMARIKCPHAMAVILISQLRQLGDFRGVNNHMECFN